MRTVCRIGMDMAKNVFQVHALDASGRKVRTRRLRRNQVLEWFARLDRSSDCLVGLEAISEAPIKSEEQQALLARQAYRRRLVERRTALGNQLRGMLAEFGITVPQGWKKLKERVAEAIEDADNGLPADLRAVLADGAEELRDLDRRVDQQDRELARQARADERSARLMEIDGIGPLTALRLVAICGDGVAWRNGRWFAVSVGLTPRQHSSGEHVRLGAVTGQGGSELRALIRPAQGAARGPRVCPRNPGEWDNTQYAAKP